MSQEVKFPSIEKCNPSTCISGSMMKCNRIVASVFRKHLKPFRVTDSQLSILFVITKAKEVNQKRITELLFMEKSTVNRNIVRLIERSYISLDGNRFLETTEKGKQFLEEVLPHWDMAMTEMRTILGVEGTAALSVIENRLKR